MTTIHKVEKKCMHCGAVHLFDVLDSPDLFGLQNLDMRPVALDSEIIQYGVQRCPNCNYVNDNIEAKEDFDASILTSDNYLKVLNSDYPELAKNYILGSMIQESIGNYDGAAFFMMHACWVLDDNKIDAKKIRLIAARLFEKSDEKEISSLTIIDLYRRAEEFEKAKIMIQKTKEYITDRHWEKVLYCQEVLVNRFDTECHCCSEIYKIISETCPDELKGDTVDEIAIKLLDANCNESIYKFIEDEVVLFKKIGILPLEIDGKTRIFTILRLKTDMDDEGEIGVFEVIGEEKLEALVFVYEDEIVDKVYEEYNRLVAES